MEKVLCQIIYGCGNLNLDLSVKFHDIKLAMLAQMVACLPLIQQVRVQPPAG